MPFKYDYPEIGNSRVRISDGADAAPTRGTIWTGSASGPTGPTGTAPDFDAKSFNQARVVLRLTNGSTGPTGPSETAAGVSTFTVWYRDVTERADANNRNPSPPDVRDVLWVKDPDYVGVTAGHLVEFVLSRIRKRAAYIQVTALSPTGGDARIHIAPYDDSHPLESI